MKTVYGRHIVNGFALFSMFFGAGNIVFPLLLGAYADGGVEKIALGFFISGVGLPIVGLLAITVYRGDMWGFFTRIGRIPGFLLILFLLLIIGPLFAGPRTETVTFAALTPFIPWLEGKHLLFSVVYFAFAGYLALGQQRLVDALGMVITPVMLLLFAWLVISAMWLASGQELGGEHIVSGENFLSGVLTGYNTMDLVGGLFFGQLLYIAIAQRASQAGAPKRVMSDMLTASAIAATLLCVVYFLFMRVAYDFRADLAGVEQAAVIGALSMRVLGDFGAFFVCVSVSFACLGTASALLRAATQFFHEHVFCGKLSMASVCVLNAAVMVCMTQLGFDGIMRIAEPILAWVYPLLIVFCGVGIIAKYRQRQLVISGGGAADAAADVSSTP